MVLAIRADAEWDAEVFVNILSHHPVSIAATYLNSYWFLTSCTIVCSMILFRLLPAQQCVSVPASVPGLHAADPRGRPASRPPCCRAGQDGSLRERQPGHVCHHRQVNLCFSVLTGWLGTTSSLFRPAVYFCWVYSTVPHTLWCDQTEDLFIYFFRFRVDWECRATLVVKKL